MIQPDEQSPDGTGPHVAYLLSVLAGGTAEHLGSMLEHRRPGAWDATVLSETQDSARTGWSDPVESLPRIPRLSRFPFSQWIRSRQIRARLDQINPQILHTYFFWSIMYGRLMKAHGVIKHLIENREDLGFAWGWFEYTLLRLTSRYPDRVVCVCEAVQDVVLMREGLSRAQVTVIRNGVEEARPFPEAAGKALRTELDIPLGAPVVGMVANFDRAVKGADQFVDCIPHVISSFPDVRFVLVGRGRDPEKLRDRARNLGVGHQFLLTGFLSDIDAVYSMMDVSVLSSLSEGLSITILESMARGIPVVATAVGGNPELVRDGETGFLVAPNDPRAMAKSIVRLLADPTLRAGLGAAARRLVEYEFGIDHVSKQYESLYRELTCL